MISTSKCVLICLNCIFWVGLVLLSLLLFIHHDRELDLPIRLLDSFSLPYDTNMLVLVVLFSTGFIGYFAILFNESKRKLLVTIFSSLLILLTGLLGTVSFFEFWHHDVIREEYLAQFTDSVSQYNSTQILPHNTTDKWINDGGFYTSDDVDRIQTMLECCGSKNKTDYLETPWGLRYPKMVPYSCCDQEKFAKTNQTCRMLNIDTESEFIFSEGCYGIVEKKFLHWLDTLIVVQSFLAVFTAIALIGSSCWIRSIRRSAIPYEPIIQEDTASITE